MTKAQLRDKINKYNQAYWKLEEAENERDAKKFIGKCFKYRNCYSCPEKPSDYWWLYGVVIEAEDGSVELFYFQKDSHGQFTTGKHENWSIRGGKLHEGWIPITANELVGEWNKHVKEIESKWNAFSRIMK